MEKYFSVCMGALLGLSVAACSNDDELNSSAQENTTESYVCVKISTPSSTTTRADNVYEYGTEAEQKVSEARFYFYDSDGKLVAMSNAWNGGTSQTDNPNGNIEFESETVTVLNLKEDDMPAYMFTVLNPSGEVSDYNAETLDLLQTHLINNCRKNNGDFIMTTTSYIRTADDGTGDYYYVTPVTAANFCSSESAAKASPITVYAERVACKVGVDITATTGVDATTIPTMKLEGSSSLEDIPAINIPTDYNEGTTLSVGVSKIFPVGTYNLVNADGTVTPTTFYAKLLGWGINATAKKTHIAKVIDKGWGSNLLGTDTPWNDEANHRSYWAKSYNYDDNTFIYQNYYAKAIDDNDAYLHYISADSMYNKPFYTDGVITGQYCNENTNKPGFITGYEKSATSNVLILAQMVNEYGVQVGNNGIVKSFGEFYTYPNYLKAAVRYLKNMKGLNLQPETGADIEKSICIADDPEPATADGEIHLNGRVRVQLTEEAAARKWYHVVSMKEGYEVSADSINRALAEFHSAGPAIGYRYGLMYYSVPIKHLNTTEGSEGYYGVVRNHYYKVSIDKISAPGHGISNPDEPIVPPDEEDKQYYISARIVVLPWQVITQKLQL
jgi:hypothetical protein